MSVKNSHRFFSNKDCQYFPCHENVDGEQFNCLFCYCPLYLLEAKCGGNFVYAGEDKRVKDCSGCTLPHEPAYYDTVIDILKKEATPR